MEKLLAGQIVPRLEAMERCLSAGLGHSSIEGSERNNPLGSKGVRVLSKFSRKTNRSCGYSGYPKGE